MNVYCCKCKRDITYSLKFYDNACNRYCYDCWEARKKAMKPPDKESIKEMYKRGLKPSEIAKKLGCTTLKVYEELLGEKEK